MGSLGIVNSFYVECRTYRHIGDTDQLLIRIVKLFLKSFLEKIAQSKAINPPAQATVMFQLGAHC